MCDEITYPFPNRWSLGMDMQFHHTLHRTCDYLSMLGFKWNSVSKRYPRWLWHCHIPTKKSAMRKLSPCHGVIMQSCATPTHSIIPSDSQLWSGHQWKQCLAEAIGTICSFVTSLFRTYFSRDISQIHKSLFLKGYQKVRSRNVINGFY